MFTASEWSETRGRRARRLVALGVLALLAGACGSSASPAAGPATSQVSQSDAPASTAAPTSAALTTAEDTASTHAAITAAPVDYELEAMLLTVADVPAGYSVGTMSTEDDPSSSASVTDPAVRGQTLDATGNITPTFNGVHTYGYDETLEYLQPPYFPVIFTNYRVLLFREVTPLP